MTVSDARLAEIQALIAEAKRFAWEDWIDRNGSVVDPQQLIAELVAALESVPALLSAARADGWDEGWGNHFRSTHPEIYPNANSANPYRSQEQGK